MEDKSIYEMVPISELAIEKSQILVMGVMLALQLSVTISFAIRVFRHYHKVPLLALMGSIVGVGTVMAKCVQAIYPPASCYSNYILPKFATVSFSLSIIHQNAMGFAGVDRCV